MSPPETWGGGLERGPWGEKEARSEIGARKGQVKGGCAGDIGSCMVQTVRVSGMEGLDTRG
jgi:hypothetical protein